MSWYLLLFPAISEGKRDCGIVSIRQSARLSVHPAKFADAVTQQSLSRFPQSQLNWNHLGLYMCDIIVICLPGQNPRAQECKNRPWNIADAGSPQPLSGLTPNQIHWNRLVLKLCIVVVNWILWTPELSNHRANSLQIKFSRTVLTCRCATSWSFAHAWWPHAMPMGVIRALGILQSRKHWADSLQIEVIGTALARRRATPWSFAH